MKYGKKALAGTALAAMFVMLNAGSALSQTLFKIITVKDEIVVGLSDAELSDLGGRDAGAVAKAIAVRGTLTLWQYAVTKAANGDLQQAPLRKVGVMANSSLRVEPYKSPLKVLPHE